MWKGMIMEKTNIALMILIVAICFCGCKKSKLMTEYGIGTTFSSRSLNDPNRTKISTDVGEDVVVFGHHPIVFGKKVVLTYYDNDDKYVCIYGEPNCWKTQDSNGLSPDNIPNKYMNSAKK